MSQTDEPWDDDERYLDEIPDFDDPPNRLQFEDLHPLIREAKDGAFERLAVMSLCARHVASASPPTAVADALDEVKQPRFPRQQRAYAELLSRIPPRRRWEFAAALIAETSAAYEAADTIWLSLAVMFRTTVGSDESLTGSAALEIGKLVASDDKLVPAINLTTAGLFRELEVRHQLKMAEYMLEQVQEAAKWSDIDESTGSSVLRLLPFTPQPLRGPLLAAADKMIGSTDAHVTLIGWYLVRALSPTLADDEGDDIAATIARRIVNDGPREFGPWVSGRLIELSVELRNQIGTQIELQRSLPTDDDIPF